MSLIEDAKRCVLIATETDDGAQKAASAVGLTPEMVLDRFTCANSLRSARKEVKRRGLGIVAIHSADWSRQPLQRLYEYAALRLPVTERIILERRGVIELDDRAMTGLVARLPLDGIAAGAAVTVEGVHLLRDGGYAGTSPLERSPTEQGHGCGEDVILIWRGDPARRSGGSVTHAVGMVAGFRALGLRVGLVTSCEPPAELREVLDELEVAEALPPSSRLSREIEHVALNAPLRDATSRLLDRVHPRFIYQRYEPFMTVGLWARTQANVPLVLEWNGSEVWVRRNWQRRHLAKRAFESLLGEIERRNLRAATIVRAVSTNAATMAIEMGASSNRVRVIPNGVDVEAVDAAKTTCFVRPDHATLGWVGTFGPWHGAPVLIEALTRLPPNVCAVMIGDGAGRVECEELARRLGVADRIAWRGEVPHAETLRLLSECDVLLSPHVGSEQFFGSPTKVFEYMALGRPIIASALAQIGEVLDDERTAKLVSPGDAAGLADGVRNILSRPDRGASLGRAARAVAVRQHTWADRAYEVIKALESSAGGYASPEAA